MLLCGHSRVARVRLECGIGTEACEARLCGFETHDQAISSMSNPNNFACAINLSIFVFPH